MKTIKVFIILICFTLSHLANAAPTCQSIFDGTYVRETVPVVETIARNVMDEAANERLTVEVMRLVADHKNRNRDNIEGWLSSIRETINDKPLNVLEHSALMFIYQNRILHDITAPETLRSLEETLQISYSNLSGRSASGDRWLSPLPSSVTRNAGETAKVFHEAVYAEATEVPRQGLRGLLSRLRRQVSSDKCVTSVTSLLAIAGMFFEPTRPYSALLLGLAQASLNEHMIHIGIGHANSSTGRLFRRYGGKAGQFAEQITMTHKLHHQIVKQNYGAVVLTPEQKVIAEQALHKLTRNLVMDRLKEKFPEKSVTELEALPEYSSEVTRIVEATRKGNYGINGTWKGALAMTVTNAPWYLLNFALYHATGSEAFLVTANLSLTAMTLQSLYSHRYLHIRPSDQASVQTNWLQRLYMRSPFGRLQQRLHYVHHESPYSIESTQNGAIMAVSVSDRLKNQLERPTVKNMLRYYAEGFLPRMQQAISRENE